ncbi:MAG: hypothetical protein JXB33_07345 [Clostridia bacterium]|nr:hypothetical protein [Clostridia bacterium]
MKDYRLRNHIPISGPATREPYSGDEPDLRVSLGFIPRWYHARLGIDFSQKWHTDPLYRYEALVKMKMYLHESFPSLPYFNTNFENGIEKTCATISGVHGIKLIPMIYGLDVRYFADDWPDNLPGQFLSKEHLENLSAPDPASSPAVRQLMGQMDVIESNFGCIHGYLNYQGILNIALKLRGNDIFMDMYDDPGFAHHLFGHIAQTILMVSKLVQARQRKSGFDINLLSMSNCVMNMVSPDAYEEFVLPYDRMLSLEYDRFGVHTCNWNVTPYLDVLRKIDKMGYIDMGMMSDMPRAKAVFPDARRAVFYPPLELECKSAIEIEEDIKKIYNELAPCDIVMADVTDTTSVEKVNEFLGIVEDLLSAK